MSLEGHAAERVTLGVDSGAALTHCGELWAERLGFEWTDRQEFCKSDRGVSSQELAVVELSVEDRA